MINNSERDIYLFEEIKNSSQKAFEELFNLYYQDLCRFSKCIINNTACAEEVVADVFANIWIKRKKITINKSVKSYLFQSTKNTTISYLRKHKNFYEPFDEELLNISERDALPDKDLIKTETDIKLNKLLNLIPQKSREVFILHRLTGLKYNDIAETLDISVKTVEKHMTKSLKLLKENYKKIINN
jgi:RNA polymerase sigma-70 factor (ECF subfamily)